MTKHNDADDRLDLESPLGLADEPIVRKPVRPPREHERPDQPPAAGPRTR